MSDQGPIPLFSQPGYRTFILSLSLNHDGKKFGNDSDSMPNVNVSSKETIRLSDSDKSDTLQ